MSSQQNSHNVYYDMWPGRAPLQMFGLLPPLPECKGVLQPEVYLKANGDLLAFLFAVTWIVTIIWNPNQVLHNPLRDRLAYDNFCVGLDTPPARYPGQVLFMLAYYATVRYATLSLKRSFERRRSGEPPALFRFSVFADLCFMAGITIFSLCFVITPFISVYGHTLPFIVFIYARLLVVASRMMESRKTTAAGYVFLAYYTVVTLVLPVYYLASYSYFDIADKDIPAPGPYKTLLPWWGGVIVDYSWFACLPLTGVFMHTDDDDLKAMIRISSAYDRDHLLYAESDLHLDTEENRQEVERIVGTGFAINTCTVCMIGLVVYATTGVAVVTGIFS